MKVKFGSILRKQLLFVISWCRLDLHIALLIEHLVLLPLVPRLGRERARQIDLYVHQRFIL